MGVAMATRSRKTRPVLRTRRTFEPSRYQDQLFATVFRLVLAVADTPSGCDRPTNERPVDDCRDVGIPEGNHHEPSSDPSRDLCPRLV
jgi:hypothetical protein